MKQDVSTALGYSWLEGLIELLQLGFEYEKNKLTVWNILTLTNDKMKHNVVFIRLLCVKV